MRFVKQSTRAQPKVSLILLDWSVRESFHLLDYLSKQNVDRDAFEVIVIEYYSRVSDVIRRHEEQVDTWLLLEMPEDCYYHKHLMYNAGIAYAKGEICVICDSDAMVKEGFIQSIITEFDRHPDLVLHLDQFRNSRRDFYPFCYPSFEDVTGRGCINNVGGRTAGMADDRDTIHSRNYGACMCARRRDLIAIGGADEHIDYLGHICGPYEMTFRLVSYGCTELWHPTEFMYHTWHPGQAGEDNYLGPHDGRHVSTTALDALLCRRTMPLLENESLRRLRTAQGAGKMAEPFRISLQYLSAWKKDRLQSASGFNNSTGAQLSWNGYVVERRAEGYVAFPKFVEDPAYAQHRAALEIHAPTEEAMRRRISQALPWSMRLAFPALTLITYISRGIGLAYRYAHKRIPRLLGISGA